MAELARLERLETAVVTVETRLVLRNGSEVEVGGRVVRIREPGLGVAAWRHSSSLWSEVLGSEVEAGEVRGLVLTARYRDDLVNTSAEMFLAVGRVRPRLEVSTSTRHPELGSNAVFHVRSNQEVGLLHYMVLAAGHVADSGAIHLGHFNIRTFHLALNSSMLPLATLLVWTTTQSGNILTQYINFPVFTNQSQVPAVSISKTLFMNVKALDSF